jgi:2-methylaconitate cis-trans-isomerase PrpF
MLDVVNPCIFVRASDIGLKGDEKPSDVDGNEALMTLIDNIRIAAVKAMDLKGWELKNPTRLWCSYRPERLHATI